MDDELDIYADRDPDVNYFDEFISDYCQCNTFDTIDEYLRFYSTSLSDNGFLTVFSQNIRSLNANLDNFLLLFPSNAMPDVFVFTETWKDPLVPVLIPGYAGFHTTRQNRRSGGVSIFVKDNFTSFQINELSYADNTIEICSVKITHANNNFTVCGIYRPHSDTIINFNHSLELILTHNLLSGRCVLTGDYNINLMSPSDEVSQFEDLMRSKHFVQTIDGVTHPGNRDYNITPSCIDHIWTNYLGGYNSGIVRTGVTDHFTLYYQIPFHSVKDDSCKIRIQFRDHNDASKTSFEEKLSQFNWNSIESENLNEFYANFISNINRIYVECFPLKTKYVTKKHFKNPWYNAEVKKLSAARVKYFSLFKQGLVSHSDYASYRNRVSDLIRKHKESYFQNLFSRNMNDIKTTWKNIRLLCNSNRKRNLESISHNGTKYTSHKDIAEIFNDFFVNIARNIENSLPSTNISPYSVMTPNNFPCINVEPITPEEVSKIINTLKNTKTDNDHIPIFLFKLFKHYFVPSLCKLISMSFEQGIFPNLLKHATVIPIYKNKGDYQDVNNFRPISILPFISKIFEKCIYNRLSDYAVNCNIFPPCQYGFRKGRSTQDALIALTENIYHCLNQSDGSFCLNVYIDFKKCFDTINHEILLNKLLFYGINGQFLKLITSYLSGRTQSVRINNSYSCPKSIEIGLPQGSLLGPLLCLFMLSDLPNVSDKFQTIQYADDTTLCFKSNDPHDRIFNAELTKFYNWATANKLSINTEPNKTYFIIHSYRNFNDVQPDIKINNVCVGRLNEAKFLGVTIDSKLKFKTHINDICSKISKSIGIMYKLSKLKMKTKVLKQIYYCLVYPYLLYNCISFSGTFDVHMHRLITLQKRAIRKIANAPFLDHTDPLFSAQKILKFKDICKLSIGLYVFDHLEAFLPTDNQNHNYNTRNCSNLRPARSRLTITQNSINVTGPNLWNSIPNEIRISLSRESFKHNYKNFLLASYSRSNFDDG